MHVVAARQATIVLPRTLQRTMTMMIQREVVVNGMGYKEVSLDFRVARAKACEAQSIHSKKNRNVCPVLDASRRDDSPYGKQALPSCTKQGMEEWSVPMGLSAPAVAVIAYFSGPFTRIPSNVFSGTFDDGQVNTGFVHGCKHNVHTGIIGDGYFDQDAFNSFVWSAYPELQGDGKIPTKDFLYSKDGERYYIGPHNMDAVMKHNVQQSNDSFKGLGSTISKFEMTGLLVGKLGQDIKGVDPNQPQEETTKVISLRDVHDLYKYGLFPCFIEDQLLEAGRIEANCVALTSSSSS